MALQQLEPRDLGAFVGDLEVARHGIASQLEGVRLAGLARGHHLDFDDRIIEFRVVRHQHRGIGASGSLGHLALGVDVGVEVRHVVGEVERGAA